MKGKKNKLNQKEEKKILNKKIKRNERKDTIKNNKSKDKQITNKNSSINIDQISNGNTLKGNNDILSKKNKDEIIEFQTNPQDIKYSDTLIKNVLYSKSFSNNIFLIFKSFTGIYYLIYANQSKSIIIYDLFKNKEISEIKHKNYIGCFNYCLDYNNKRDLIMTIDPVNHAIKVYNLTDCTLIHEFNNINKSGYLNYACFYNDTNNIYIVTSNHRYCSKKVDPIKIYDLQGNKIKDLKDSEENVTCLNSYYDKKLNKNYLLVGFSRYIKAYNFDDNTVYKVYKDKYNSFNRNIIVNDNEEITKLIESSTDCYIRIWDFHKGELIKRILINDSNEERFDKGVFGICLWNNECLFVGIYSKIILININTEKVLLNLKYNIESHCYSHAGDVLFIKKINHPKFGECLISSAYAEEKIQIWTNKKQ